MPVVQSKALSAEGLLRVGRRQTAEVDGSDEVLLRGLASPIDVAGPAVSQHEHVVKVVQLTPDILAYQLVQLNSFSEIYFLPLNRYA